MADDDPDRPVLSGEDLDRIRARLQSRANLGVAPTSPAFLDAIMGSLFGDLEGPAALEVDGFYDFAEVVVRQVIPTTSFGSCLDDWAESLHLERRGEAYAGGAVTFVGAPGTVIATGQQVITETTDEDPVAFAVDAGDTIPAGGELTLTVTALTAGSAGNVPPATVTTPAPFVSGVTALTNEEPMSGGADVEGDESLSQRVADALAGELGSGTIADYERLLGAQPGVGFVTVRPAARGPGTVDVYIADLENAPMPASAVLTAQAVIDPVSGEGRGLAPIGHNVLILTHVVFGVLVVAEIEHEPGYSLDGDGGTIATRASIIAAVRRYIDALPVGDPVIRNKVIGAIVAVRGVVNVASGTLRINSSLSEVLGVPANAAAGLIEAQLT